MQRKVLIIEDDPDLLELLRFNFRRAGYAVETAADGVEGLKQARQGSPDLILLDIMLPDLNGYCVCELLREDLGLKRIPIVMVTALGTQFARLASLEHGATEFIPQPFKLADLLEKAASLLRERNCPAS